jgi:hypothetical protein
MKTSTIVPSSEVNRAFGKVLDDLIDLASLHDGVALVTRYRRPFAVISLTPPEVDREEVEAVSSTDFARKNGQYLTEAHGGQWLEITRYDQPMCWIGPVNLSDREFLEIKRSIYKREEE